MATTEPLLPSEPEGCIPKLKDKLKGGARKGGLYCIGGCCVLCLAVCIVQGIIYATVTAGCGPTAIGADYSYPGGGKSMNGTAKDNLIPQLSLLAQRQPNFWGWAFDLLPANSAGSPAGAQTGTFWRNTGPLFYTYTYEDIANSKLTMYMRKRFWMPYMSFMIARCDGTGPTYSFTEGSNWISNKIRSLFHMNQAQTYFLYADGVKIANVQEIAGSGFPSLTINDEKSGKERASALLKERTFHGDSDVWYISNHFHDQLPFFLTAATALPTAFDAAQEKIDDASAPSKSKKKSDDDSSSSPTFLFAKNGSITPQKKDIALPVESLAQASTQPEKQGDVKLQHV